jgi:hypothetical protein
MRIACNANIHVACHDEKKHFVLKSKGGKPRLLTVNLPPCANAYFSDAI